MRTAEADAIVRVVLADVTRMYLGYWINESPLKGALRNEGYKRGLIRGYLLTVAAMGYESMERHHGEAILNGTVELTTVLDNLTAQGDSGELPVTGAPLPEYDPTECV
jgi:hypothetical protein